MLSRAAHFHLFTWFRTTTTTFTIVGIFPLRWLEQQFQQRHPDFHGSSHFLQLIQWEPRCSHWPAARHPVCPSSVSWVFPGASPRWACQAKNKHNLKKNKKQPTILYLKWRHNQSNLVHFWCKSCDFIWLKKQLFVFWKKSQEVCRVMTVSSGWSPMCNSSVSTLQHSTRAENGQLVCSTVL